MPFDTFGRILLVVGLAIAVLGLLMLLLGRFPAIGRLPGDIYIQRGNTTIWIPIVTSIIASIVLSLILAAISWLFRR